jgi:AmiR/NasT family two-component response regulator
MRVYSRSRPDGRGRRGILPIVGRDEEVERLEQELADLREALVTRGVIGEAKGILMERFWLTDDEAFELLKRLSSEQEVKLRDIAAELVRTREIPPGSVGENPRDD